ncbi:PriCT-2 domain-containing protein [Massilia soli]|uniref:PriCT-2 domain-containing protein n=1 Tax=Massilia soli TaxID=2792854 RepID=A0ABS7SRD4_9BURK|nr:PriCT-2 domain-containing protein [Massilia soli]MBZ2208500.1 PriCT-2 domain-containing protein [Massilia soli]
MSYAKAVSALNAIAPVERATWVRAAMALKSEFGEDAFDLWNDWSKGATSYCRNAALAVWRSIGSAGQIRIGTLYREAAANGWRYAEFGAEPLIPRPGGVPREDLTEEARKKRGFAAAVAMTKRHLAQCKPSTHGYLISKGLPNALALVRGPTLIAPMYEFLDGELVGCQRIDWRADEHRWHKEMQWGTRAKGGVLWLGNQRAQETFFCEGLATGISIEMALRRLRLNASVAVCFNAYNLSYVGSLAKGRAFVFADNDVTQTGELAAKDTGLPYCMSEVVGEDANDLHQRAGIVELCRLIIEVRMRGKP